MKGIFVALTLIGAIISSCGGGKKLEAATVQIQNLSTESNTLRNLIADQRTVDQLKVENQTLGNQIEDCRKHSTVLLQRLDRVRTTMAEKSDAMQQIRAKVDTALKEFRDAGAIITYHNGRVYISMADKLLFPSGSTKVSDQGRQALSVVADVLAEYPAMTAIIIGNTDSIAIRKTYTDNWSLSTERANVIVRILRDNYDADPARLTAAGRGRYNPIAGNNTNEGRAINRRTDIVLDTDLSMLWGLTEDWK
jgi:chemotaxis protein MotB